MIQIDHGLGKTARLLIGIFVLSIIVLTCFSWYKLQSKKETPKPTSTKTSTTSAKQASKSAVKDETADWKTYTGETNGIEFSLKHPANLFVTGFAWTSSPKPDPEAAGFSTNKDQQPGSTAELENGEIRLAIKAHLNEQFGIQEQYIKKPSTSSSFAGLKALKFSGRVSDAYLSAAVQRLDGMVVYYVNNEGSVDKNHHLVFECKFSPYSDKSLESTCETIASTFKFL